MSTLDKFFFIFPGIDHFSDQISLFRHWESNHGRLRCKLPLKRCHGPLGYSTPLVIGIFMHKQWSVVGSDFIAAAAVSSPFHDANSQTFICPLPWAVWPDLAIFCTLGNFLKPWAAINLPKSPTFLGNFCKGVKIYHFSSEIIFGQLL